MTPKVEAFYNHFHAPKDGRFAIGGGGTSHRSGPGKGLFSIARTSKSKGKLFAHKAPTSAWNKHKTMWGSAIVEGMSANVEEFYNHVHGKGGRFTTSGGGGRTGHVVTGPKLPLRNYPTGRLNPKPVHAAFKQGLAEIMHHRKQDSKRTTLKPTGPVRMPGDAPGHFRKPLRKTETVGTIAGRVVKHISSKGGASRDQWREGSHKSEKIGSQSNMGRPTTPYEIMKAREVRQGQLAQTNRARANYGMPPISG